MADGQSTPGGGPTPQTSNRTFARMYARFASQFAAALHEHGKVLSVDTVCIDWGDIDTLNASSADAVVDMNTYGCTCGEPAVDDEFVNALNHGLFSAGRARYVAGLDPQQCPLTDAQVRWRFDRLDAAGVGAVAIWGIGNVGPGGASVPIVPSQVWWDSMAKFLGRHAEPVAPEAWWPPMTLAPAPPVARQAYRNESMASWGGSVIADNAGTSPHRYHMFASSFAHGCGLMNWQGNSEIIHATSTNPAGPYRFHDVALPSLAHNPEVTQHPGNVPQVVILSRFVRFRLANTTSVTIRRHLPASLHW